MKVRFFFIFLCCLMCSQIASASHYAQPSSRSHDVHCLNITEKDRKDLEVLIGKPLSMDMLCPARHLANKKKFAIRIAEKYNTSIETAHKIVHVAHVESKKNNLDPVLLLSVIATESGFNPRARSRMGALGLMQTIPKWHLDKMQTLGLTSHDLLGIQENIALGALILRDYMNKMGGNKIKALQKYNGSLADKKQTYSVKVLAHYRWLIDNA